MLVVVWPVRAADADGVAVDAAGAEGGDLVPRGRVGEVGWALGGEQTGEVSADILLGLYKKIAI